MNLHTREEDGEVRGEDTIKRGIGDGGLYDRNSDRRIEHQSYVLLLHP